MNTSIKNCLVPEISFVLHQYSISWNYLKNQMGKFYEHLVQKIVWYISEIMLYCLNIYSTAWNYLNRNFSFNSKCCNYAHWLCENPRLCGNPWLCENPWLCGNSWFCGSHWVGIGGPPKYSTPWLLWTPINCYLICVH